MGFNTAEHRTGDLGAAHRRGFELRRNSSISRGEAGRHCEFSTSQSSSCKAILAACTCSIGLLRAYTHALYYMDVGTITYSHTRHSIVIEAS